MNDNFKLSTRPLPEGAATPGPFETRVSPRVAEPASVTKCARLPAVILNCFHESDLLDFIEQAADVDHAEPTTEALVQRQSNGTLPSHTPALKCAGRTIRG
ncbi:MULTISPECIES: hypothetical protein [unclassified Burkholderia]|uniref:hypothetical protein n=1 Tax=unclassified Burkholderia TaxID=2613784 RepID=UPI0012E3623C|nr:MULTISPECIES: hypothetical protein [unclassified Burkholderia]